ncbi:MAG: cellulase family glycosylhydrolase [bacterium]
MNYNNIRGFNYQPSYGSSGLELWRRFDADIIRKEIGRGKKFFPKMNAVRFWLSSDAFVREPELFGRNFETALAIFAEHGLEVMPVLFNRWHDKALDYGGIYIDHFTPGNWAYREDLFDAYVREIVGAHRNDPRIFVWDLCNEPCPWGLQNPEHAAAVKHEYVWLARASRLCKEAGATAPLTVGVYPTLEQLQYWEPLSDILSFHPYAMATWSPPDKFEPFLDECVSFAQEKGKPLLATECCWGSLDDRARVEIIKYTLGQLKKRNIGWLAYLLHHSLIADAHRPEFGPLSDPGNLSFIEADGSLRPGHEIFNDY